MHMYLCCRIWSSSSTHSLVLSPSSSFLLPSSPLPLPLQAFSMLPNGVLQYLLSNVTALDAVLTYHVIAANVTSSMLVNGESVPTLQGSNVTVRVVNDPQGKLVLINDARVIAADNMASNGVVHVSSCRARVVVERIQKKRAFDELSLCLRRDLWL